MPKPDEKTEKTEEKRLFDKRHNCMICGEPGPETICEHCKIVVQAEAVARKQKIEKEGKPT
jgi:hypothetical protein